MERSPWLFVYSQRRPSPLFFLPPFLLLPPPPPLLFLVSKPLLDSIWEHGWFIGKRVDSYRIPANEKIIKKKHTQKTTPCAACRGRCSLLGLTGFVTPWTVSSVADDPLLQEGKPGKGSSKRWTTFQARFGPSSDCAARRRRWDACDNTDLSVSFVF